MVKTNKKKHLKIVSVILSLCLLFTAVIPTANASATGSFDSSCAGPAGLLKWLICPAIDGLTGTLEGIYGSAKSQLNISSEYYSGEREKYDCSTTDANGKCTSTGKSESGLHMAWSVSRDVANILFIILFLVVIVSQLTGIGIDNYGIKKILPRLIICALLINLSFIICELLIDLSNIVGGSIDSWMTGLAEEINKEASIKVETGAYFVQLGAIIIAPAVAGAVSLGFIFALIIVLFHGIGAAITLFFIAVVRKISVMLIVAISPLAFAAYLLPNTEKLFKKWVDWLKAILIIYPICSILVGGGALAGAILNAGVSTTQGVASDIEVLAAMVAPLLPLWFLPKFLKGSLASLGAMGQAVSNWREKRAVGRKRRARKVIDYAKSSQAYKSAVNTAKIKAMGSKTGQRVGSTFSAWQSATGGGAKNALKRGAGTIGSGALAGAATQARQEKVKLQREQQERQLWSDTTMSGQYIDAAGHISSTPTAGARQLTKGELYAAQMEKVGQAQFENAQIKGYEEQFSTQSRGDNEQEVAKALQALDPQRFAAAFRTLIKQGGEEEALKAIYTNASFANNASMRAVAEREMGGSGSLFMREFSKFKAKNPTSSDSFADFIDNGGLAAQLNAKGDTALAGATKETFSFMADVASTNSAAFAALNDRVVANAATSLSTSDQAAKFDKFVTNMSYTDNQQQNIVNEISTAGAASMFDSTRQALSSAHADTSRGAISQVQGRFDRQFNGSVDPATGSRNPDGIASKDSAGNYANNAIRSKMNSADISKYGL